MSKPQSSPGTTRTSRTRALEIGTNSSGFPDDLPYDVVGGFPSETPGQGGQYKDPVTGLVVDPLPPQPSPIK